MAEEINQEELLNKFNSEGLEEPKDTRYVDSLVEVFAVDTTVTGPKAKYEYMQSWTPGQAMVIIGLKVLDGEHKGAMFEVVQNLFNSKGEIAAYKGFSGNDGYVPASYMGEIISKIKEYDKSQWNNDPLTPDKLKGCKFRIGVRSNKDKTWVAGEFERQLKKDEEYRKQLEEESDGESFDEEIEEVFDKPQSEKKEQVVAKKSAVKKVSIDSKDLPF